MHRSIPIVYQNGYKLLHYGPIGCEPFIRLQEETNLLSIKCFRHGLNKQQDLARIEHGPVECQKACKPLLKLLEKR